MSGTTTNKHGRKGVRRQAKRNQRPVATSTRDTGLENRLHGENVALRTTLNEIVSIARKSRAKDCATIADLASAALESGR